MFFGFFMANWELRNRPIRMEKRFEFEAYEETRVFLDRLGDHSEKIKRFPDISFGKTYVNITIRPDDEEAKQLTDEDQQFAADIDLLVD